MLAQAASAGYQYSDAPPSATGGPPSQSNLSGGSPSTSGVGDKGHSGSTGGAKNGGSGANGSSGKNGGSGSGETGKGQGSPGKGGSGSPVASEKLSGTAPGSDSGGSSPLVPILIAIVLLAGGSVAYLMIKRRRGAGVAGGPDKDGKAPGSPKGPGGPGKAPSGSPDASPEAS